MPIYFSTGHPSFNPEENEDTDSNEPYLDLIDYLLDSKRSSTVPTVLTTSCAMSFTDKTKSEW
jgi:hypothetical protein